MLKGEIMNREGKYEIKLIPSFHKIIGFSEVSGRYLKSFSYYLPFCIVHSITVDFSVD